MIIYKWTIVLLFTSLIHLFFRRTNLLVLVILWLLIVVQIWDFFSLWRNNRQKVSKNIMRLVRLHFSHLFEIFQSGTHKGTFLVVVLYYRQSPFFPKTSLGKGSWKVIIFPKDFQAWNKMCWKANKAIYKKFHQ